ncbi:MAG: Wzt carbohydrate-binding domain-containing protein [Betaproteobacteria bacterium]
MPTLPAAAGPSSAHADPLPTQSILFDHIAKTGGTTLHALLQDTLGASQCSPIITGSIDEARAEFDRFRCVTGHLFFHPRADIGDLWTFTVLRRPLDRILSHLAYSRHDLAPTGDTFSQQARALDLVSYIESDDPRIVESLSNTMVAHFATLAWDGAETLTDARRLALAKEVLRRFDLVGLTERMGETADLLCHALGAIAPPRLRRLNVSSHRPEAASLPAATHTRLQKLNELDTELYAYARELHDACRRRVIFGAEGGTRSPANGSTAEAAATNTTPARRPANFGTREIELLRAEVFNQSGTGATLLAGEIAVARIVFRAHARVDDLTLGILIHDDRGRLVFATNTRCYGQVLEASAGAEGFVKFVFRADIGVGHYTVGASVHPTASHLPRCYHWVDELGAFDVVGNMGWHFEGATKLSPDLEFGGVSCRADTSSATHAQVQRLARISPPIEDFRARLTARAALPALPTGQLVAAQLDVTNLGVGTWPSLGERSVRVSYHWLDARDAITVFDGERTLLPHDLAAGESVSLWANVRAPDVAGDYRLQLSLVQESIAWLEERGGEVLEIPVTVTVD